MSKALYCCCLYFFLDRRQTFGFPSPVLVQHNLKGNLRPFASFFLYFGQVADTELIASYLPAPLNYEISEDSNCP